MTETGEGLEGAPDTVSAADSAARNSLFALAVQFTGALFTGVLTLVLVRKLGPDDYGIYALATAIAAILVIVADFGIAQSAARFIAERRKDHRAIGSVLSDALRLKLLATAVICGMLIALAGPIADAYDIPGLAWPLRVVSLAVFGQSLMFLWNGAFEAVGRIALTLRMAFGESAVETGSSIVLVLLGTGATGAIAGRTIGYAFGALLGFALVMRSLNWRPGQRGEHHLPVRDIARYAAALAVIDGAMTLFSRLDVLLIGGYLGAADAGKFEAPLRITILVGYVGAALAAGVTPGLAKGIRDEEAVTRLHSSLRLLIVFQAAVLAPLVFWAHPIVDLLLGSQYQASVDVLRALAPYVFLAGLAAVVTQGVNYLGEARRRIPVAIAAVLINLVIDVILIPRIGIVAGAIGSGAAFLVYVPVQFLMLRRALGLRAGPLLLTTLRALAAALGGGIVLALVGAGTLSVTGSGSLSAIEWIGGLAGGLAAFVAVLLLSRETTISELRGFWSAASGRFRAAES